MLEKGKYISNFIKIFDKKSYLLISDIYFSPQTIYLVWVQGI